MTRTPANRGDPQRQQVGDPLAHPGSVTLQSRFHIGDMDDAADAEAEPADTEPADLEPPPFRVSDLSFFVAEHEY